MRLICRVAAEFTAPDGTKVFEVGAADRLLILEAPEEIKNTLMFKWLCADGSIDFVDKPADQKKLENDPVQGAAADGTKKRRKSASKASQAKNEEVVDNNPEEAPEAEKVPEEG